MNWTEFKSIFEEVEIIEEKLVIKKDIVNTLNFIKNNYHFDFLRSYKFPFPFPIVTGSFENTSKLPIL